MPLITSVRGKTLDRDEFIHMAVEFAIQNFREEAAALMLSLETDDETTEPKPDCSAPQFNRAFDCVDAASVVAGLDQGKIR